MNNARRTHISNLANQLDRIKEEIGGIQQDEQDSLDNTPESLQESERYQIGEEAIENLEAALDGLDDVIDYLKAAAE